MVTVFFEYTSFSFQPSVNTETVFFKFQSEKKNIYKCLSFGSSTSNLTCYPWRSFFVFTFCFSYVVHLWIIILCIQNIPIFQHIKQVVNQSKCQIQRERERFPVTVNYMILITTRVFHFSNFNLFNRFSSSFMLK